MSGLSEYGWALAELVELPGRLDRQLGESEREVAAERRRREKRLGSYTAEHSSVLARLEAALRRAREEGVDVGAPPAEGQEVNLGRDPFEQASQLVDRLEQALGQALLTREALRAEEARLAEEAAERAAEERRRREREKLRRDEAWEQARQGTFGLLAGIGGAVVVGVVAAAVSTAALLVVATVAAAVAGSLALGVASRLPAIAVLRATGVEPELPQAPAREARLGASGYAGAVVAATGLGGLATAGVAAIVVPAALISCGTILIMCVWLVLPRQ